MSLRSVLLAAALLGASTVPAQECPNPRQDLCPPNIICGVPINKQCSCLSCATGSCELVPKNCNDGDPCTIDSCDELVGCRHRPLCEDDDPCTDRRCIRVPVVPQIVLCGDPTPVCDDGRFCNGTEACTAVTGQAQCAPGAPQTCDDADACTQDVCRDDVGCQHTTLPCDDGDACTTDLCDPARGCTHAPVPGCCRTDLDCAAGDACALAACDAGRRCAVRPVDGFDALACVCRRPSPAACAGASLPGRLATKQVKACALVLHAASATGVARERGVAKAGRLWKGLERLTKRAKVRKRLGACADALAGAYRDALDRATQVAPAE